MGADGDIRRKYNPLFWLGGIFLALPLIASVPRYDGKRFSNCWMKVQGRRALAGKWLKDKFGFIALAPGLLGQHSEAHLQPSHRVINPFSCLDATHHVSFVILAAVDSAWEQRKLEARKILDCEACRTPSLRAAVPSVRWCTDEDEGDHFIREKQGC